MLEFGDSIYYFDLKGLDKAITVTSGTPEDVLMEKEEKRTYDSDGTLVSTEEIITTSQRPKEIDAAKHDILRTFIEYIVETDDISDDSLGADRALGQMPLSFKMVFNTLIKEGIIKEKQ